MLAISGITPSAARGAAAGTLTFSPSSASLGSVAVGSSGTLTVTVSNTGRASETITSVEILASGFSVSGLTAPMSIAPGGSVALAIKFSPTSTGFYSGYIKFSSNVAKSSVEYSVSGTGVLPGTLSATPSSASFGSAAVGSKNSQTVQLANTGGSPLMIEGESLSGAGFTVAGLPSPLSLTLAAGQTTSFTVEFEPATTGSAVGSLTLKSTATNPTLIIPLSGTGIATTKTIALSAASLNFGNELVGETSTLGVALKNTGNSSLTVSGVSVSGTGFSVSGGVAGTTIAAGQTAELNVVFAPKVAGSASGKVSIASNASNSPNTIGVAGAGVSSAAHSVTLSWEASSSSNLIGYYVYRSTISGGSYTRLASAAVNALNYTDATVNAGQTYYYVVTTVNASGLESGNSGQISATIP